MKITVVSRDDKQLVEIARLLRDRSASDDVTVLSGTIEKFASSADMDIPDMLVLAQAAVGDEDLERLERLGTVYPGTAFALVCEQHTPEFLLKAMRAGVREVLPMPAAADTLFPAIRRISEKRENRSHANGKILAFISCKGGSGATFLATNLGYALASLEGKRVALLDLNLQFGDASLFVSEQKPLATLADVAQQIHRLDASFLAASMLNVAPNYGVLAAPDDPTHADDVHPEHIDVLLRLARRNYDFVLLDIGHNLNAVTVRALDQADMIFPVLQTTLPYIRDGKRLLGVFRSLDYRKDKIHVIVNRHEHNGEIRLRDLENAFDTSIYMSIPNHYDAAAASVNQGVPILKLARSSPISRALAEFAAGLVGGETVKESQGWLARVFQRA